jgi:DAK2 domain fusion protein YloV
LDELNISGALLREMFYTGAALLEKEKSVIDALNVFPVPDGDTGTNMCMTMQSAVKELKGCQGDTVSDVASSISLGALKGARGNSGVILSQLFRGFAKAVKDKDTMDPKLLAEALRLGTEAAYKAVMRPKEGTMLTVSRMISDAVNKAYAEGASTLRLIETMLSSGALSLEMTPQLLPVLKEAGVVDSGGKGLLTIYRGFKMAVDGESVDDFAVELESAVQPPEDVLTLDDVEDIKFGYCTEFFIIHLNDTFTELDLDKFRDALIELGDSVVVAHDVGYVKVHVHSDAPGRVLQLATMLGEINNVKIENMREQNRQIQENLKKNEKETAMVSVSAGDGIGDVFKDLGVTSLIEGGQTMNPSIDTILKSIRRANARNVFVLPNNSNIILAAQQAAKLSDRNVTVIPTKTIMQGISAAMAFNPDNSAEEIERDMTDAFKSVKSGSVTYAVRTTSFNGTGINEGDIIGLMDGEIVTVNGSVDGTSRELLRKMLEGHDEDAIVTIFYGNNMDEDNANALVAEMEKEFPHAEFIVQYGGQPLYYYYFSVE